MNEKKEKIIGSDGKIFGYIIAFISFLVFYKIIVFIVTIIGVFILMMFNIHTSESMRAASNLESFAIFLGFIGSLFIASKVFHYITKKNSKNKN